MIGYVTLGTNDMTRAKSFYDPLMEEMGAKKMYEMDRLVAYGFGEGRPLLTINLPFDGGTATIGNGAMIALMAETPADVDRLFAKAIALGATSEGDPGPRGEQFYGGYFRDLDGNKLNFFVYG